MKLHDYLMTIKSKFHEWIIQVMRDLSIFDEVARRKKPEMKSEDLFVIFKPSELERLNKAFKNPDDFHTFMMKNNTNNMRSRDQIVKTEL